MVKAIFVQNRDSIYNDLPGHAYHFPARYLKLVEQTIGDWIVLYETERSGGGTAGYFAIQKIKSIEPDSLESGHYYALYEKGNAARLDFLQKVPIRDQSGIYYERHPNNWQNGIRLTTDDKFYRILDAGMSSLEDGYALPRQQEEAVGFAESRAGFQHQPRETILTSRKFREPKFREGVIRAYEGRCAISGLELRNGGGRAEVQAAHIQSVESDGPDAIQNGLALSGTLHWMFDRGLVSIDEDNQTILIAKDTVASESIERLVTLDRKLILPKLAQHQPHPQFIKWHREHIFHG